MTVQYDTVVVIEPMTLEEAQRCTEQCRLHAHELRMHIAQMHHRRGWEVMGYASFESWAETELQSGYKWALKLKMAADVQMQMEAEVGSPQGEIPTKHAEQLSKLPSAKQQVYAYDKAKALALSEGSDTPSTRHVKQAVTVVQDEIAVDASEFKIVRQMMHAGTISATAARQVVNHLNPLPAAKQAFTVQVIERGDGITAPDLVPRIAAQADDPASEIAVELRTGYLNGRKLVQSSVQDFDAALAAVRRKKLNEDESQRDDEQQVQSRFVTIYRSKDVHTDVAAQRTLSALAQALPLSDLLALHRVLGDHIQSVAQHD